MWDVRFLGQIVYSTIEHPSIINKIQRTASFGHLLLEIQTNFDDLFLEYLISLDLRLFLKIKMFHQKNF